MRKLFRRARRSHHGRTENGNVLILVAFGIVGICGVAALTVDAGVLYFQKAQVQDAADATALAGASDLLQGATAANAAAATIAAANDAAMVYQTTPDTTAETFTVTGSETTPLWFARVLGYDTGTVHAAATAALGTLTNMVGAVPICVTSQTFTYGQEVALTAGAGNGQSGNFGFLDFSGNGANGDETDLEYGYDFALSVGEQVSTETGVMSGPVSTAIQYRMEQAQYTPGCSTMSTATSDCSRVLYLPIIDTLDVSGAKDVTILGFAAFYLEGLEGDGGQQQILGRFIQMVRSGTIGQGTNYGTYSVKLT